MASWWRWLVGGGWTRSRTSDETPLPLDGDAPSKAALASSSVPARLSLARLGPQFAHRRAPCRTYCYIHAPIPSAATAARRRFKGLAAFAAARPAARDLAPVMSFVRLVAETAVSRFDESRRLTKSGSTSRTVGALRVAAPSSSGPWAARALVGARGRRRACRSGRGTAPAFSAVGRRCAVRSGKPGWGPRGSRVRPSRRSKLGLAPVALGFR